MAKEVRKDMEKRFREEGRDRRSRRYERVREREERESEREKKNTVTDVKEICKENNS